MDALILGDGRLGRAIAAAFLERGDRARIRGRPTSGCHDPADLAGADVAVEASRGDAVADNVAAALEAGVRGVVIATSAWERDRPRIARLLETLGGAAVAAPNLGLGMALFGRLVDEAVRLYGPLPAFDPYIVEWHRRGKADRPSGTALALAARITAVHPRIRRLADPGASGPPPDGCLQVVGVRAGANPGVHLVGFDAPGEVIELRCTARDRSAYAAGALAAADWLLAVPRAPGIHPFDAVVDDLLAGTNAANVPPAGPMRAEEPPVIAG